MKVESHYTVSELPECLTLIQASHADMDAFIPAHYHGNVRAIMFNLGYLPGGDKSIITRTASTIKALTIASRLLSGNGIITVMAYPGHQGGDQETDQVNHWCEQLDPEPLSVSILYSSENHKSAPRLFVIGKQG